MGFLGLDFNFSSITDIITKPITFLGDGMTGIFNFVGDGLTGIVNFAGEFLTQALNNISGFINNPIMIIALIGGGFLLITLLK